VIGLLDNTLKFNGMPNNDDQGFVHVEKALPGNLAMFKRALATPAIVSTGRTDGNI